MMNANALSPLHRQTHTAPWVSESACNHGSVLTLLGQMGTPHSEPDMLFVLPGC